MTSFPSRLIRRITSGLLIVPLLVACSGTTSPTAISPAVPTTNAGVPATSVSGATTGHVGDALAAEDGNAHNLMVTLLKISDPASVVSSSDPPAANRWVVVQLSLVDLDADEEGQTLTVDGMGSDGKHYTTSTGYGVSSYGDCIPNAAPVVRGQAYIECHPFSVPKGVILTSVGYTAAASSGDQDQITWMVP